MKYTPKVILNAKTKLLNTAVSNPNGMKDFLKSEPELMKALEGFARNCAKESHIQYNTREYESILSSLLYGFSLRGELDRLIIEEPSNQFSIKK